MNSSTLGSGFERSSHFNDIPDQDKADVYSILTSAQLTFCQYDELRTPTFFAMNAQQIAGYIKKGLEMAPNNLVFGRIWGRCDCNTEVLLEFLQCALEQMVREKKLQRVIEHNNKIPFAFYTVDGNDLTTHMYRRN